MPDDLSSQQAGSTVPTSPGPAETPAQAAPVNTEPPIAFDISEEFSTREKNLPPGKIVAICLGILAVAIIIFIIIERPTASASGSINDVSAVAVPDQNTLLVAINVAFRNNGKQTFWIRDMKADLVTADGKYSDTPASAMDYARYFQAFPALKAHALPPVRPEEKIDPYAQDAGTLIVSFPVTMDAFNSRKSLTVTIWPYDQEVPLVMTK